MAQLLPACARDAQLARAQRLGRELGPQLIGHVPVVGPSWWPMDLGPTSTEGSTFCNFNSRMRRIVVLI